MALVRSYRDMLPSWGHNCMLAENATLVGNVRMGDDCSVWYGAVLRADVDGIFLGNRVNVQDGACIHQSYGKPVVVEDDVTIGHLAVVHGCTIKRGALVGMNATVLDGAEVGEGAIVAAGAVVLQNVKIGSNEIWAGVPARFVKVAQEGKAIDYANRYVLLKEYYK